LNQVVLLGQKLVHSGAASATCDQRITIRQGDRGGVVQKFVVWLTDGFDLPLLGMGVENYHFVSVTEETYLFVSHLDGAMVYSGHMLDSFFKFLWTKFNLRIGHLDRHQLVSLVVQLFLVSLKVLKSVADVSAFNLLTSEILDLISCGLHIFFTKVDKGKMLFKIFLFPIDSSFFDFECLRIFQLNFSFFQQDLFDDFFEVLFDLLHNFDLSFFYVFGQIKTLVN